MLFNFSPNASDEEKIIFLHTRQVSQRKIKAILHVGCEKITKVIRHFKSTGEILKPKREKYKLTPEILTVNNTKKMSLNQRCLKI